MKRLLLKLFSLIVIKRLTSALKQTVIARYCFGTVNIFKSIVLITFLNGIYGKQTRASLECHSTNWT